MKMYGGPAGPDAEVDNGLVKISVPVRKNRADLSFVLHPLATQGPLKGKRSRSDV